MTKQMIEITFGNAMTQARQLDECAETMERLANGHLTQIREGISSGGEGTAAQQYMQKMDMTAENMRKTADKLRKIADTLRRVARIFRESELRVLEIASQRTY